MMLNYSPKNMKSLCFSGCSITFGDELRDPANERFSKLVSGHYGVEENNISECGISNDLIVRRTIQHLERHPEIDYVCLQFTVHSRLEYFDERGVSVKFTPQKRKGKSILFYKYLWNDCLGAENFWKNVFLFDSYCKSKGIKYVSLVADHYEYVLRRPETMYTIGTGYWRSMCDGLRPVFIQHDLMKTTMDHPENYANGPNGGHPSAIGHKIIAEKVIGLIDHI